MAQVVGEQYAATGAVSAVLLAGSRGRGRSDAFSDVEVDVHWDCPPSDEQRCAPAKTLSGEILNLWPYDHEGAEWSEDLRVSGIHITVSGFTCAQLDHWIDVDVTSPTMARQMRLSALKEGEVVFGPELVNRWRASMTYPRELAIAVASGFLTENALHRWRSWRALQHRDDLVMLQRACVDVAEVILGVLCAINRIYIEHPSFKWSRHLSASFHDAPWRFSDRFFTALRSSPAQGAEELDSLLKATVRILERDLPEVVTPRLLTLVQER